MAKAYHESLHPLGNLGIQVSMAALENTHIPAHWHEAMEILFCLNGSVRIHVEHEHLTLQHNQLIVFDSKEVHSIHSDSNLYMFLCIHVDKKRLSVYCPDLELYHIKCRPVPLDDPKSTQYIHICQLAHDLTRLNVENESTSAMRSDGTALLMLADLIRYFSVYSLPGATAGTSQSNDTLREIITYVNEHYTEKLSLEEVANQVGFSREYFCRFFKQHMGITFLQRDLWDDTPAVTEHFCGRKIFIIPSSQLHTFLHHYLTLQEQIQRLLKHLLPYLSPFLNKFV